MITSLPENSTPSLILQNFSQTSGTFMLFSPGNSFHFCCLGNLCMIASSKAATLGGEICLTDVIMHKGSS